MRRDRAQARQVERADDRPLGDAVPLDRGGDLVQPRRQLQVDVQRDVAVAKELEGLVQRRAVVGQLVERVAEHERPVREREHVELDRVDAVVERGLERGQRVLGRERGRAAVPDTDQRARLVPKQPHGRVGRKSSSSSPPRAAYSTIIRSVTHSTGARSSVQGRSAFSVTGRI